MVNIKCVLISLMISCWISVHSSQVAVDQNGEVANDDYYYSDESSTDDAYYSDETSDETATEAEPQDEYYGDDGSSDLEEAEAVVDDTDLIKVRFGFLRPVGGGVVSITGPLLTPRYLERIAENYSCLPRLESRVPRAEIEVNEIENVTLSEFQKKHEALMQKHEQIVGDNNVTTNATTSTNKTSSPVKAAPAKKLSFRELQEQKMKERQESLKVKEAKIPKFKLGSDCETLVCGSCKVLVEEFGKTVRKAVENPEYRYVEDVFVGFCSSKEIQLRYVDLVGKMCLGPFTEENNGYLEALISPFEDQEDWKSIASPASLWLKKKKVCLDIGACAPWQFELQTTPTMRNQEQWDDKCYVCQAFADDVEERVTLTRYVTESSIVGLVAETCNRMGLDNPYDAICRTMEQGKLLDDISWMAKVHGESVLRGAKSDRRFADYMCEDIKYCEKWIEPEILKAREEQKEVEAVFF